MGGGFSSPPAMEANRVGATRLSVVSKWKPSEWGRSYLTVKDADGNVLFEVKGSGICNLGYVMSDEDGDKVLDAVISFAGGQVVHIDGGKHTGYTGTTNTNFMLGMSVLQMSLKSGETFTGVVYKRIGKCRMDLYPGIMSTAPSAARAWWPSRAPWARSPSRAPWSSRRTACTRSRARCWWW